MPEILTKYPESAIQTLKGAGAKCGLGVKQQILTSCPPDHFCALPHGEICVYGIEDIHHMTQIHAADLTSYVGSIPSIYSHFNIFLLMLSCLFGIMMGIWLTKKSPRNRRE
ncbi:MAG: hypothetical protein WAW86_05890 [Gammaproteobacteria bacterium]